MFATGVGWLLVPARSEYLWFVQPFYAAVVNDTYDLLWFLHSYYYVHRNLLLFQTSLQLPLQPSMMRPILLLSSAGTTRAVRGIVNINDLTRFILRGART